jgi:hypothetical protein
VFEKMKRDDGYDGCYDTGPIKKTLLFGKAVG